MKHLLGIEPLSAESLRKLLDLASEAKKERANPSTQPLTGQTWAMIFSKSSTRTRVSFEVGIRELGGSVMFLSSNDIQLGRGEPITDTARVLGRMVHGAIIRTFAQDDVENFAKFSKIPTINALTDEEHPCQIVADLQTILEQRGTLDGLVVTFAGDGDCNVARSWAYAAQKLEFELRIAAPKGYQPPPSLAENSNGFVKIHDNLTEAAEGSTVLYTDVWVSMGKEKESEERINILRPFQVNQQVVDAAAKDVMVMHCLPAYREKEITTDVLESHADTIFTQAENRLHAQKGVLKWLTQ